MTARGFRMVAASVRTPVGRDLSETLWSVRLSVQRVRDTEVVGADGLRARAACVFPVRPGQGGLARQQALFDSPLDAISPNLQAPFALIVCGPEWPAASLPDVGDFAERYEAYRTLPEALADHLATDLATRGAAPSSRSVALGGHTAALDALRDAPATGLVLLVAASCLVDPLGLQLLSAARVGGALPPTFVPGEAAVLLAIEPAELDVADVVVGDPASGSPHDALAEATNALFDAIGPVPPLACVWSDQTGERWRSQAHAFAGMRAWGRLGMTPEMRDVARSVGDVGAAAGALQLALAWASVERGGAALVTTQNRGGSATTALVRRGPP